MASKRIDEPTGTETVGHEWDGIEELNTPLPRWWLWTFYLTVVFAIGYVIAYPAIPLLSHGTEGVIGWTSRGQLDKDTKAAAAAQAGIHQQIAGLDIQQLAANPDLMSQAVSGGRAAFLVNCVQCHGSGAAGSEGYPNLNDDDWLWGGSLPEIEQTLQHGIRQPGDDATRTSQMPAFADILEPGQVSQVADYVLSLSGKGQANAAGAQVFADNCAVCHGADGKGLRQFGAPDLADAIWLYGGTKAQVVQQVRHPRHGVMPAWQGRLDPVTIRMLAAYVHSLGGGEDFAEIADAPAEAADEQP
ncbi:cytochrome-c oxidase, cbb3-type subunit III [Altererythrobacter salegens]|uniref:Cbb3-type cytochrome c oxidase subunit n=1 Tax=Croceibacterium salegens TaxID=1737568 RepID=A0A6I4T154_9SPHN|nr:cytochrome-c oxidase, cbb3-type subunit III [Croceibacterium salegens]MXO61026.1 cytochrome-c oxidase, cbb3-type subunit III [Croceibacterium salegens]